VSTGLKSTMCSTAGADREVRHVEPCRPPPFAGETVSRHERRLREAEMYRYDSIKLMLAWEMCCRFYPHSPLPIYEVLTQMQHNSPWIGYSVHVSQHRGTRRTSRTACLRSFIGATAIHFRHSRPYHQEKVPGRLRPHRVDSSALWQHHGSLLELLHVWLSTRMSALSPLTFA
jgi:hypothetical protein